MEDWDTLYFIISALNQLDIDYIRNKILLKGGKESLNSNLKIVELWHQALTQHNASKEWVEYLQFNRKETQAFLEKRKANY